MQQLIAKLLEDFENGKMTRRELIQALAITATAVSTAGAAPPLEATGFEATAVNHLSYTVNDVARTRDFYAELLGMRVGNDDGKSCTLAFGDSFIVARKGNESSPPAPRIDHFAITIADWNRDAVEAELNRRGLDPRPDTDNSFIIEDPEGFRLQISGEEMKV